MKQISSYLGLEPVSDCTPVRTKSNKVCCDVWSSQSGGMFRNRDTCGGSHSEPSGRKIELRRRQQLESAGQRTRGGVDGREQPQSPVAQPVEPRCTPRSWKKMIVGRCALDLEATQLSRRE